MVLSPGVGDGVRLIECVDTDRNQPRDSSPSDSWSPTVPDAASSADAAPSADRRRAVTVDENDSRTSSVVKRPRRERNSADTGDRPSTIRDVAAKAEVSVATVSECRSPGDRSGRP
nr:LacI family DNA-binding transcriptional regulator [Streptomyces cavernae]